MHTREPGEVATGIWQIGQALSDEVPLYLHLVVGPSGSALVDGGLPSSLGAVGALLAAAGVSAPDFLLNTHAHHDHIGTFAALRERTGARLVAAPGAVRWIEDLDANLREFALHRPDIIPDTPQLRAELDPTYDAPCHVDITMRAGGSVRLGGGVDLVAYEVPGHVDAELCWFERSSRTLILGDVVTGTSWSFFHGHVDPVRLRTSLHLLRTLVAEQDVRTVCLSHYPARDAESFLTLLGEVERHVAEVAEVVHGQLADHPRALAEIWRGTCAGMGRVEEFRGLAMVDAHLRALVESGRARQVGPDSYVAVASADPNRQE